MVAGQVAASHASEPRGLSKYQLVAEIGRGGMADVFLAIPRDAGAAERKVVIKQLRADIAEDDDFRAMFMDEARLASRLVHPNVVRTFEVGKEGQRCFIVMEFLNGQPFSRLRRRGWNRRTMPLGVQVRILADSLAGLDYVHGISDHDGVPLGVVHRDVTPQNVFVTYDGHVKLVDFGIAKAATRLAETRIGVVKGKLGYMAPEHARGEQVDRRSDIFSVGVMLWEASAERRYWHGEEELTIFRRLLAGDIPKIDLRLVHPALAPILERALSVEVEGRYSTAAEMQDALESALRKLAPGIGRAEVGACTSELFARERTSFHIALRAELLRIRAGEPRVPGASPLSLVQMDGEGPTSQRTPTPTVPAPISAPPLAVEEIVEFRPRSRAARVLAWAALAAAFGFAGWSYLHRLRSRAPVAIASRTAADAIAAMVARPEDPPTTPRDESAKPRNETAATAAPRVWHPPPPHARAVAPKPTTTPIEELPKPARARRALDKDDPWAE